MHSRLFIGGGSRFFIESDEFAHIACDGSLRDTWDFYVRTATNIFLSPFNRATAWGIL